MANVQSELAAKHSKSASPSARSMEQLVSNTMLYDFYGELLTEHQKQVYEDFVWNDMTLTEIGETYGISRQAVSDLIKRINKILNGYESKLHLVEKFASAKEKVKELHAQTQSLLQCYNLKSVDSETKQDAEQDSIAAMVVRIEQISSSMLEDF